MLISNQKSIPKRRFRAIFKDAPGEHSFDRIDTKLAKETRMKIYKFLSRYLNSPKPFKSLDELEKAGYR
jgi:hypothetical protein